MKKLLLGDIHGNWSLLKKVCANYNGTVVGLGDIGIGFRADDELHIPNNFEMIFGNHDDRKRFEPLPQFLGPWGMKDGVFFVSGANSVDKKWRREGIDWWPTEELHRDEMEQCLSDYEKAKPEIVISHEAPFVLHPLLATASRTVDPDSARWGEPKGNATAFLLDQMFKAHKPKRWYFGHWHVSLSYRLRNCRFVCLDVNETLEIEI